MQYIINTRGYAFSESGLGRLSTIYEGVEIDYLPTSMVGTENSTNLKPYNNIHIPTTQ